jgi:L,D-transpeptidase ErfK/SrfK
MTPVGASVRIIDQPVKIGRFNGALFMEAHEPLEEDNIPIKVTLEQAQQAVIAKTGPDMPGVDQAALQAAMEQVSGIPVSIGALPGSMPSGWVASPPTAMPQTETLATPDYPTTRRAPFPVETRPGAPLVYDDDPAPVDARPAYRPGYAPPYDNNRTPGYAPVAPPPAPAYPRTSEPPPIGVPPAYRPYPPHPAATPRPSSNPAVPPVGSSTSHTAPTTPSGTSTATINRL